MNRKFRNSVAVTLTVFSQILFTQNALAQKASEVIEDGITVKADQDIFLRLSEDKLYVEIAKQNNILNHFYPLDESFFLVKSKSINVYMSPPLNPLNYSTTSEVKFINDEINDAALSKLTSIISGLSEGNYSSNATSSGAGIAPPPEPNNPDCDGLFNDVKTSLIVIAKSLRVDKKKAFSDVFYSLKSLDFKSKKTTEAGITKAKSDFDLLKTYYDGILANTTLASQQIENYTTKCKDTSKEKFIAEYILNQILKEEILILKEYDAKLQSLLAVYNGVKKVSDASKGENDTWYYLLGNVIMQKNKVATYSITVNSDGFGISEENKISKSEQKALSSATLKFRDFQRFIPEISLGVAYTYLTFPNYTVETDNVTNKQIVVRLKDEEFKRINFTTMVNFNYYIPKSLVHPFLQVGAGVSASYPTLFVGGGLRFRVGDQRFAIAGGFASTWIKTLNKLNVGDAVSGQSELDDDIKFEFAFPVKPYLALQYNF